MSVDLSPYALDPFGPSANPSVYVACEASERARKALERSLDAGRVAAVVGPPGHGKTLLLRLLGGREEERARVAYVPFCTLEVDELFALALNALGVSRPGPPRDVLLGLARELAPRGGVVILVDDANALSDACATALSVLYSDAQGALRIGLAAVSGRDAQRVFRAFGSAIDVVQLADGMSGREARRYVETRLAYGGARPELVAAFDEDTIAALHHASQGVPRRLNQVAQDVVRRSTRDALPRLREITGAASPPPVPIRPPLHATAVSTPAQSHREPPAQVLPPAPAPVPLAPPAQALPPAPPPAPREPAQAVVRAQRGEAERRSDELDDGRGILLPEIFDRIAGEPSGEYRLVRGRFVDTATGGAIESGAGAPSAQRGVAAPKSESVLVARPPEPPARQRKELPTPSEYARRQEALEPPPTVGARLPIRIIGIAGFALGVALALFWTAPRGPAPPAAELPPAPPAVTPLAVAPPVVRPAQPRVPRAPRPAVSQPKLQPVVPVAGDPRIKPAVPAPTATAAEPGRAPAPDHWVRVSVAINATPWAYLRVDGREIGETPLAGIELEPGPHVFQARMPDGSTREQVVEVTRERVTVVFE